MKTLLLEVICIHAPRKLDVEEGTEIECFASAEELRAKVLHYLERDEARARMAARAGDKARRLHTYERRMATLLATVADGR